MIEINLSDLNLDDFYASKVFFSVYEKFLATIKKHSMLDNITKGVLLGFSGGADSVMALLCLKKLREEHPFALVCMHINHMIRGDEANYDEEFSRNLAKKLDIEFVSRKIDVPALSVDKSCSIELAAREARYSEFRAFIESRSDITTLVTAHNSTDNLETVIFNLQRGAGTRGISGINPIRDGIVRPLIEVSKSDITEALLKSNIPYTSDSTNDSDDYTRNFIRHNILPKLYDLNDTVEQNAIRLSENLRCDADYIDGITSSCFAENYKDGKISSAYLCSLHKAIFLRIIRLMSEKLSSISPERIHIDLLYERLKQKGDFALDIQGGLRFLRVGDDCKIIRKTEDKDDNRIKETHILKQGINHLSDFDIAVLLSYDRNEVFSSNVYNFSTQVKLPDDIIIGDIRIRAKQDGDSYRAGGMTRRLKRLFSDKKIPKAERNKYPVICDDEGILFVPGFPTRDYDSAKNSKFLYISIYTKNKIL